MFAEMFLLVWGSFLTACSQLVSPLVTFLLGLTCTITEYELNLRAEIRDQRKELANISMQDQFAAYAKMDKKEEPIALPFNAIFEDAVEELYKDLDKRRHAISVANRAVSAFGNTPGLKWGPPIYDRFKLPS